MTWIQTSLLLDKYVYYLQKNHIKETCACCTRFCTVLWLSLSPRYPEVHNCKQLACFPIALLWGRWSDIAIVAHNSIWSEEGGSGMAVRVTDPPMDLYQLTLDMRHTPGMPPPAHLVSQRKLCPWNVQENWRDPKRYLGLMLQLRIFFTGK